MANLLFGPILNVNPGDTPAAGAAQRAAGVKAGLWQYWDNGEVTVWGTANGAITAGDAVVSNVSGYDFKTLAEADADDFDPIIGVALATAADNDFVCVSMVHESGNTLPGVSSIGIKTGAAAAADAQLSTTGTAGQLDDGGTTSQHDVFGIRLTTATGTAAAAVNTAASWAWISLAGG